MPPIDYKSFNAPGSSGEPVTPAKRWWLLKGEDLANGICFMASLLSQYDSKRATQNQISARLYGNVTLMGVNGLTFSKISSAQNALKDRISYNLAQSVVDTLVAKMRKNKPKPLFLTSGGDWKLIRRAKKLDKFTDGIFYENKVYELGPIALRDACVFGDGIVHVFPYFGKIKMERVLASELFVDQVEAFYGRPRQLHRVKSVDREVLIEMFPEKKSKILEATNASADLIGTYQNVADQIAVVESWHLRSGPDAKDGRHTIVIPGCVLLDEEYRRDTFPFAFLKWCPRVYGFWGQGLVEQVQNIQLEINKLLWVIQRAMHLSGSFKILLENGSKIVKEHINNDIGAIIAYTGTPPQYITPPAIAPEIYQHVQTLTQKGYEQAGISMLSAASQKPLGLNSGKALREYNDIESERFMSVGQGYENFMLDIADLAIDVAREIHEENGSFPITVPGRRFLETIDWDDIDLARDEYIMQKFPVSSLPNDPAGRLQTIQEYMQAGLISPRAGRRALDFPDLEALESLANAEEDYLTKIVELIVDEGIYTRPELPYDDPELARELALEQYALGKANGLDQDRLQMLRDFMDDLTSQQQKAQDAAQAQQAAQQQQAAPGAGASPMAAPQPQPVSELVPNVA